MNFHMPILNAVISFLFYHIISAVEVIGDLKLVQIVFRHGDRAPLHTYKTDPYGEKIWKNGLGGLTKTGMKQHFELGEFFKLRYSKFLESAQGPNQVYIRSSDQDRTLQSAAVFSAGMFPPLDPSVIWDEDLGKIWRPVSVHSVPWETESLLSKQAPCLMYEQLMNQTWKLPEANKLYKENRAIFDYVVKNSGESAPDKRSAWDVMGRVRDVLFCQFSNGYSFPQWMNQTLFDKLNYLSGILFHLHAGANGDIQRARLAGGNLLALIEQRMRNSIQNQSAPGEENIKMFIYSGHDTSISGLLSTLQLYDYNDTANFFGFGIPKYASVLIVELFQNNSVRISFKEDPARIPSLEPTVLKHPSCELICPFQTFEKVTKDFVVDNWEKECKGPGFLDTIDAPDIEIGLVIIILVIILTTIALGCYRRKTTTASKPVVNGTVTYSRLAELDQDDTI